MNVGKTYGEQLREARLKAAAYNEKLATQQGAAEALDVSSPETIGRWERDEVTGHYRCQKCADFARAFSGSCAGVSSSVSART